MVVHVSSQENAHHHRKQTLPAQASDYKCHLKNWITGAPFPFPKRENVKYRKGLDIVTVFFRYCNLLISLAFARNVEQPLNKREKKEITNI
ncbi:hypothetical protein ACX4ZD_05200, partial [Escherichia coli]